MKAGIEGLNLWRYED